MGQVARDAPAAIIPNRLKKADGLMNVLQFKEEEEDAGQNYRKSKKDKRILICNVCKKQKTKRVKNRAMSIWQCPCGRATITTFFLHLI
jgi:uncharacterized CHY-type Zn-finger protein